MCSSLSLCSPILPTNPSNDYFNVKTTSSTYSQQPVASPSLQFQNSSTSSSSSHPSSNYSRSELQPSVEASSVNRHQPVMPFTVQTPNDINNNSLSGPIAHNGDVISSNYNPRPNKTFTSPLFHRKFNDSVSSLSSDATAVNESFFLKHKGRNDSTNSSTTLFDDSPEKLKLDLPKLSINEDQESHASSTSSFQSNTSSLNFSFSSPKVRSYSLGITSSHPSLNKSLTSPNIRTHHDIKNPDYISMIQGLSEEIEFIDQRQLNDLLTKVQIIPELKLPNLIAIDLRPFTEYITNHLADAINLCLPSTLLRRSNFSFIRVINSLPTYEKMFLKTYFNFRCKNKESNAIYSHLGQIPCGTTGFPSMVIYGSNPNSVTMYNMVKKIIEQFTPNTLRIYLLTDNFNEIVSSLDGFIESGKKHNFNLEEMIGNDTDDYKDILLSEFELSSKTNIRPSGLDRVRSHSLNEIPRLNSFSSPIESSTPILSTFKLPTPQSITPKFKIRHNEEVLNNTDCLGISLTRKYENKGLPEWLGPQNISDSCIVEEFNRLESIEKDRLNKALDLTNDGQILGAGIEKGYKNRYKDIFIFESTRVKLNDFGESTSSKICDYINASYIDSTKDIFPVFAGEKGGYFRFIASQGPLKHTIGDFYKMILNNKSKIIISLTNEFENGIMKCEPYWIPGIYNSNDNEMKISVVKAENLNDGLIVRNLEIETTVNGQIKKSHVIQFQVIDWMDKESCVDFDTLLLVIKLRELLFNDLHLNEFSTIIHCSAGCGRTGSYIAIDTLMKLIDLGCPIDKGSIFKLVDSLRRQRMSMVQNLRQYISIYDTLMNYITNKGDLKLDYDIIKEFTQQSMNDNYF